MFFFLKKIFWGFRDNPFEGGVMLMSREKFMGQGKYQLVKVENKNERSGRQKLIKLEN